MQLNQEQQQAVDSTESVLVLSGAGTGKTRVIVARIAKLIQQGVAAEAILAVTFTNKAAREMRERLGRNAYKCTICTFHALGVKILRQHPKEVGLPRDFVIIDPSEQASMLRRIIQGQMGLDRPSDGGPDPKNVARLISKLKDAGYRAGTLPRELVNSQREFHNPTKFIEAFTHYDLQCQREGKVDFSELLLRTKELFDEHKEIRKYWTKRYEHILIDELQDVNQIQLDILARLKIRGTTFFGVGDDDQSIYAFRGAMPYSLEKFKHTFTQGKVLYLQTNYRSTNAILRLANCVISQNEDRFFEKTLTGNGSDGAKPKLTEYADDETEARGVAEAIANLRADKVNLAQVAVFYRNHALSQLLEAELTRRGIPYVIRGGRRYFDRAEIKTILAYLRVALASGNTENSDEDAIRNSINTPPRKIGPKTLEPLMAGAAGATAWHRIVNSPNVNVQDYVGIIRQIAQAASNNQLIEAVKIAIDASGLKDYYKKHKEDWRIENLEELVNVVTRYSRTQENAELAEFINSVTLEDDVDKLGEEVSLLTIHAAKGLEYDHVYLVGLEEGILPDDRLNANISEERRLLYVAITRARAVLNLSYAKRRMVYGDYRPATASTFLNAEVSKMLEFKTHDHLPTVTSAVPTVYAIRPRPTIDRYQQKLNGYKIGQRITSPQFGVGVILGLEEDEGSAKAKILFTRDRKQRWLNLALTGLSSRV